MRRSAVRDFELSVKFSFIEIYLTANYTAAVFKVELTVHNLLGVLIGDWVPTHHLIIIQRSVWHPFLAVPVALSRYEESISHVVCHFSSSILETCIRKCITYTLI